tara:strand:- start:34 stop:279 length:246 start_codon:yes stop_codon:yes gene_type:complete
MNRRHIKRDHLGNEIHDVMVDVTWDQVRRLRDERLQDSDWRAMKDRVLPTEWKEYRQALRDITEQPDPNSAADAWPVMPDE